MYLLSGVTVRGAEIELSCIESPDIQMSFTYTFISGCPESILLWLE